MPIELFVLADTPAQGLVNERLLSLLSPRQAVDLYKAFVEDTVTGYLTACRLINNSSGHSPQVRAHLACYPDSDDEFFQDLARKSGICLVDQGEGEKGQRIYRLQRRSLDRGALAMIVAEVDSPGISQATLPEALRALESSGMILGPTERGGLYLFGFLSMDGEMFLDIPWGTSKVAEIFRTRLRAAEQEFEELPEFWSITTPDDLIRLKQLLSVEPGRAPATSRVLRAIER